jgi:hypothetical protein
MFTGIIQSVGLLRRLERRGGDVRLEIGTGKLDLSDVKGGDSIATNGVCLTVVGQGDDWFAADVSLETLSVSSYLLAGYMKRDARSSEAALKYLLVGSAAAAVFLYGASLLYGLTGGACVPDSGGPGAHRSGQVNLG